MNLCHVCVGVAVHLSMLIGAAQFYRASWRQLAKLQGVAA